MMRPVTGCWPPRAPGPPPPNPPRAPVPPRAPLAPVAPAVLGVGVCALSKVMPAAKPPPARTSAEAIPITICGAFIFKNPSCSLLLVSQCLDRMEPRCAHRWIETEDDSDRDRNADRDDHRAARDQERHARRSRNLMNDLRDRPAKHDPKNAAEPGKRDRLDEELRKDVAPSRADRLADPDLAGPLVHRDKHDVHDPDASAQEGDPADRAHQHREAWARWSTRSPSPGP